MEKRSKGFVNKKITAYFNGVENFGRYFLRSVFDIDIASILKRDVKLNKDLWIYPEGKQSGAIVFFTKFNAKTLNGKLNNYFKGKIPLQQIIVHPLEKKVELLSDAGSIIQKIEADYDERNEIITGSIKEEVIYRNKLLNFIFKWGQLPIF